jgi:hypothetical protein
MRLPTQAVDIERPGSFEVLDSRVTMLMRWSMVLGSPIAGDKSNAATILVRISLRLSMPMTIERWARTDLE